MFGSKDYVTSEQLDELAVSLTERIDLLEKKLQSIQHELTLLHNKADELITMKSTGDKVCTEDHTNMSIEIGQIKANDFKSANNQPVADGKWTLYLQAPNSDGVFVQSSDREQIGKSIYQLTTTDDVNGSFILIDTPDSISTAMISVSQFIKPVCKVIGNVNQFPRHIVTEEEGTATKEVDGWRVTRKAIVRFE